MKKEDIEKAALDGYYLNADMIRFLLIENLALKTLLHKKGLLDPKEFQVTQAEAEQILDSKAKEQMQSHMEALLSKNPPGT